MEHEGPNRREFLQGALGLLSLLTGLPANAQKPNPNVADASLAGENLEPLTQPSLEQERRNLILDFRKKALGFDVQPMLNFALGQIGIASEKLQGILKELDCMNPSSCVNLKQGVRSIRQLATISPDSAYRVLAKAMESVDEKRLKNIKGGKIRFALDVASNLLSEKEKKDSRALELYKTRITGMIRQFISLTLGIDIRKMANHVAKYSRDDMAILYGPNTMPHEYLGSLLHEPFALYLQMINGRRATEIWPVDPPGLPPVPEKYLDRSTRAWEGVNVHPMHSLAHAFFNPRYQHLAMVSHGSWNSFSYSGYGMKPEESVARLIMSYNKNPNAVIEFFNKISPCSSSKEIYTNLGIPFFAGGLSVTNPILEQWINQFCFQTGMPVSEFNRRFRKTGKVVRYTCGHDKYQLRECNRYELTKMIPRSVYEMMVWDLYGNDFSAANPDFTGMYEAGMAQTVQRYNQKHQKKAVVRMNAGFGLPLVNDPGQLYGYEGTAWLDNYIPNPFPKQGRIEL